MDEFNVYKDIKARTKGEIYLGIVGPVRTGKSTFIKQFMDLCVIPGIEDEHMKKQALDELPQSAAGRTIMTTEPKFIPKDAVEMEIDKDIRVKVRLIDCVGFLVEGASGHMEDDHDRMVKTPWFNEAVPFKKAAHIGTEKVIREHATIGVVVTTDGSFGEISRGQFEKAEEETIAELQKIGKPFIILLNTAEPYSAQTDQLCRTLEDKYNAVCMAVDCSHLKREDIHQLLATMLLAFPVSSISFYTPKWFDIFGAEHPLKQEILATLGTYIHQVEQLKDIRDKNALLSCPYIHKALLENMNMADGSVVYRLDIDEKYYYELLSDILKEPVTGTYAFYNIVKRLVAQKAQYHLVEKAVSDAASKGYGIVTPQDAQIVLQEPELVKHGSRYGFKIKANAPSIHMLTANIETEIAPIVGTQEQAEELVSQMQAHYKKDRSALKETLIFGKTVGALVDEGIEKKITGMSDVTQLKMQEAIRKIVNDSNGGVIFIII